MSGLAPVKLWIALSSTSLSPGYKQLGIPPLCGFSQSPPRIPRYNLALCPLGSPIDQESLDPLGGKSYTGLVKMWEYVERGQEDERVSFRGASAAEPDASCNVAGGSRVRRYLVAWRWR